MKQDTKIVVTGASGFIGGHLVKRLVADGYTNIRAIGRGDRWWQQFPEADNRKLDLTNPTDCDEAVSDAEVVFHLAADIGGIQYIQARDFECMRNVIIDANVIESARKYGVGQFILASSACVYPDSAAKECLEDSAFPANPATGYGWAKIMSEKMVAAAVPHQIARLHTIYGPHGDWEGSKAKVISALCRKVAEVALGLSETVHIYGDGTQTRTFLYVDDAVELLIRMATRKHLREPINIGHQFSRSVIEVIAAIEEAADLKTRKLFDLGANVGLQDRGCNTGRAQARLGGLSPTLFEDGITNTYSWVLDQVQEKAGLNRPRPALQSAGQLPPS